MKKIWNHLIPFLAVVLIMGLIAFGAQRNIPILEHEGTLRRIDRWAQDRLYQHRSTPSSDIIIIGIDDETFAHLGPYDGTSYRQWFAMALYRLASDPENLPAAVAIGVTTFLICFAGVAAGCRFGARYEKKAPLLGGIVLILIGIFALLALTVRGAGHVGHEIITNWKDYIPYYH